MTDTDPLRPPTDFAVHRYHVDLSTRAVRFERLPCEDLEDALGGIARAAKFFARVPPADPYEPSSPLLMNLGLLSGTRVMTGLRTFFHGYSPLKVSKAGVPGLMWSAASGHFGTKLRGLGIDDVVFTGRSDSPVLVHLTPASDPSGPGGPASVGFVEAPDIAGRHANDRIQDLKGRYPDAHFAVIGPAGEHFEQVRYAAIALSTDNQLKSGDPKARFAGRGGYGGVMGSKNLVGIIADGPNPSSRSRGLKDLNREINTHPRGAAYRDIGTWRQMVVQKDHGVLPEANFHPPADDRAVALQRDPFEAAGGFVVKDESCYLCGIKCHKNVYEAAPDGTAAGFRAKLDYEPLALLSVNLGIYDRSQALDLVALCDELCMDAISLGGSLGYAMEWNRRHPDTPLAGGIAFGDFEATMAAITAIGEGRLPEVGQGAFRMARDTGEWGYAMQCKGVEFPAYLPHHNPGYPWALAGGHMTMRTFLSMIVEGRTDPDYWVNAITNVGWDYIRSDLDGLCKFSMATPDMHAEALRIAVGLDIDTDALMDATHRAFLRGYAIERSSGFDEADYVLPDEAHDPLETSTLEYFNTREFFNGVQARVLDQLDRDARAAGFLP